MLGETMDALGQEITNFQTSLSGLEPMFVLGGPGISDNAFNAASSYQVADVTTKHVGASYDIKTHQPTIVGLHGDSTFSTWSPGQPMHLSAKPK